MTGPLHNILTAVQDRLRTDLESDRAALPHPVAKGDASENTWQKVLASHLPHRYQVCRGSVIDSRGEESEQLDLIIYDRQYTPLLYNHNEQRILPAEAVYAVFEVKQRIDHEQVKYAGIKAASVRRLHRTSASVVDVGRKRAPRKPFRILTGILAFASVWQPPLGDSLRTALADLPEPQRLDLGCVAQAGAFRVLYDRSGIATFQSSPADSALAEFYLRLLAALQSLGTVPAIDYSAYGSALGMDGWRS
jgi:Domain of unknown function (DUF6602)